MLSVQTRAAFSKICLARITSALLLATAPVSTGFSSSPAIARESSAVARLDAKLSSKLETMLRNSHYSDSKDTNEDKVSAAGDELTELLLAKSNRQLLLNGSFTGAKNSNLHVATSPDRKLRIFSWDSMLGGTMHPYESVAVFSSGATINAVHFDTDLQSDDKPPMSRDEIYCVKSSSNKTYYLVLGSLAGSSIDFSQYLTLLDVRNNKLVPLKAFKADRKLTALFEARRASHLPKGVEDAPLLAISKDGREIKAPVLKNDTFTGKFNRYVFNGSIFEKFER